MKKPLLAFSLTLVMLILFANTSAQDVIKITQYNLLYFGLDETGCDQINNNIYTKTNYLKTIINYLDPDIFAVNEISDAVSPTNYQDYLLGSVFLYNDRPYFTRAEVHNETYNLTSQIFYNSNKLTLKSTNYINSWPRDIHAYKFYYNSPDLINGDTVYFTYYLAHLKAGDTGDDADTRNDQANDLMSYINYHNSTDNYFLSGDLNLYTNTEGAYQRLTNYSNAALNFIDPETAGDWHNNSTYADIHTQSAFYSSNSGCGSSGGLDDRFDFIIFSNAINNNTDNISYVANSYRAVGQDGNHFNSGVSYNGNTSVPTDVLNALASNSDHLPVYAEFLINQTPANLNIITQSNDEITCVLKSKSITVNISNNDLLNQPLHYSIYNITGQKITSNTINLSQTQTSYTNTHKNLDPGIYIINFYNSKKSIQTKKTLIQ
ncbi:MAG: T9SS type A sorting domain-containing protein [Bacteroidales bacterium]|nr:T9SS type A sorting domain-containing protein [Bacteroidales bacterium]